ADLLRRGGGKCARPARPRPGSHQDRALWSNGIVMVDAVMRTLDGNAIAGLLTDVFGEEMTSATGTCASCGASGEVATFVVYARGPGPIARCGACSSVLMVLVTIRERTCVDLRGLVGLEPAR